MMHAAQILKEYQGERKCQCERMHVKNSKTKDRTTQTESTAIMAIGHRTQRSGNIFQHSTALHHRIKPNAHFGSYTLRLQLGQLFYIKKEVKYGKRQIKKKMDYRL